jgi:WD40 repeat protein
MSDMISRLGAALEGRYRIEHELGAGGMATVYLAEDLKHDRKVALKVLKPELTAVLGGDRFIQEIKTTASLQHPHILPLFDSGTAHDFLFYVMPYIEGETLRDKLERETQLGLEEALRIATEVADALDYAHRQGIIHRDIKPENILLHDGRPMVADFGIALALSAAAGGRMTETGTSLGTPHYMSPEQATADKELTARSDIYSLGSVLYEMLTGDPPHTGSSAQQVIMKIIADTPRPVTDLRRSVPPNVTAAVAKALEKLPADRFESARAFADALKNPAFMSLAMARTTGATIDGGARLVRSWRRAAFAAIAVTVLAVAGVISMLTQSSGSNPPAGPTAWDIGLENAPLDAGMVSLVVSPDGDFVVYQTVIDGLSQLWYRSLLDETIRRIDGTDDGWSPALSPDGSRLAFMRAGEPDKTLEILPMDGGTPTVLARVDDEIGYLQWLPDGRLLLIEGDGKDARWVDPDGGPTTARGISYCIMAAPLPDPNGLICGGGGTHRAYRIDIRVDSTYTELYTDGPDSTFVFGSNFRVVDGRYLVWLSAGGDLLAAPVDLEANRVGRPVRMATGLGRDAYSGAGTFALSASGTLVWARGANKALGYLVAASDEGVDTLHAGREAFLRFSVSPNGRRLATVIESLEGDELRVYDLETGRYVRWPPRRQIRHPVWSPGGDRLLFQIDDSVFVGSPDATDVPEFLFHSADVFEAFRWLPGDRIFGVLWQAPNIGVVANLDRRPVTLDTLLESAALVMPSPDGRWVAYNSPDFGTLWLEPLPRTGRRYPVATGNVEDPQWLSSTELAFTNYETPLRHERVTIDPEADPPVRNRRAWLDAPRMLGTAGLTSAITPDGRIVYVEGQDRQPIPYLRVVPDWVSRMRQVVDEANR